MMLTSLLHNGAPGGSSKRAAGDDTAPVSRAGEQESGFEVSAARPREPKDRLPFADTLCKRKASPADAAEA
jgi:hypothetical protein